MAEYGDLVAANWDEGSDPVGFVGDLIVGAPRLHRITSLPSETTDIAAAALFNKEMMNFVSVMARDVLLWHVDSGTRAGAFCSISASEYTTACFDDRERKLFLGCYDGELSAINLANGAFMKAGAASAAITKILYHVAARCLVCGCADGALYVFDDEPQVSSALQLLHQQN